MERSCINGILLLLFFTLLSAAVADGARVGGWKPVEDTKDPHLREVGEFAVSEFNKQQSANLELEGVVEGYTQVVSGVNYRLVLAVKDGGGVAKKYEAVVWEKTWLNLMELTSFTPV